MRWRKNGLIFNATGQHEWMSHHASMPTADRIDAETLRIYFGPRTSKGKTVTTFLDVSANDPTKVLYVHDRPILESGRLGAFDDSGAMPSMVVDHGGLKYLYYIGWNEGVTVPYRNSIGLAISRDGGVTFERAFEGPVVDRTRLEPFFCATPFVMVDNGVWKMWYASSTGYLPVDGRIEPVYQVKYAESADGIEWKRNNTICLDYKFAGEANARPTVVKEGDLFRMWYCARGSVNYRSDKQQSYRIGYAESTNGVDWTRMDDLVGIDRSETGWDSLMMAYPFVYEHGGQKHMLYCGDGFGETGFGVATLVEDDRQGPRLKT